MLALFTVTAMSQQLKPKVAKQITAKPVSKQLKTFIKLVAKANTIFIYPPEFKEIPAITNKAFSFDYAMELSGQDFEIWLRVRSQKKIWEDYKRTSIDTTKLIVNPDSLYNQTGLFLAGQLTSDKNYFTTVIPQDVLARYNATAGKTYLLELLDAPETKHYKYALLITLHKDHVGTIVAVCFGNDKGAEFFKNISKVSKCLKFKP